jgi:hypothetical protein
LDARLEKIYGSADQARNREIRQPPVARKIMSQAGRQDVLPTRQVFKVWQDRFDDVYLISKKVPETKLRYIHANPLQEHWDLVSRPEFWPDSSAMFYELGTQPQVFITDYRDLF